jgi:excisionase family DNA binding protein
MTMTEWLSTRQTADRLGVSEATVRRWGDRGLLPVHRVGRRRERRFPTDRLEQFRQPSRPGAAEVTARPDTARVSLGATVLPVFTHLACFYDTDDRMLRLASPFLRDGIQAGQPCILAAAGREADIHLESLRRTGVDVDRALRTGGLTLWSAPTASTDEALSWAEDALWAAVSMAGTGDRVIRAVGEALSQRRRFGSEADLMAFEAAMSSITGRFPGLWLCQYDVREFSGPTLLTALRAHPDMLALPLRTLIS